LAIIKSAMNEIICVRDMSRKFEYICRYASVFFIFAFCLAACHPEKKNQPAGEIRITMVGDILMGTFIGNYIDKYGVDYPWKDVSPILNNSDLAIANLETSVSTQGDTIKPVGYGFRSKPETLQGLVNSGIRFVSIANNHTLDFGEPAFFDTLDYLKKYNIAYAGGGRNIQEAKKPYVFEKNGITMAFISYTEIVPYSSWKASETNPGISAFSESHLTETLEYVESLSKKYDLVFVILHWGLEHTPIPEKRQINIAHQIIDRGAAGIIGHHPHVLQPLEFYKNKPILYSIGNFVFLVYNEKSAETGIFEMSFDKKGFKKGFFYPAVINYCKANLLDPQSAKGQKIIGDLNSISRPFGARISANGEINMDVHK